MSSITVSQTTQQAQAADPGSGIYLAFIPWVLFTLLAQHSTLKLAAIGALLAAALIAARSVRAGSAKVLELGAVLAFIAFTVVAFKADPATVSFLDRYARAIAAGLLATIAFGSLLVTPFTEQYAREPVPRQLWSSPQFKQINRQLTTMWGLVFAAMVRARDRWSDRHPPRQPDLQLGDPDRARDLGRQADRPGQRQRQSTTEH